SPAWTSSTRSASSSRSSRRPARTSSSSCRCRSPSPPRATVADPRAAVFESVQSLIDEHRRVQEELSDPAVHAAAARAKRVNRRFAELSRIVRAHEEWTQAGDDLAAARELADEDPAFADEIP